MLKLPGLIDPHVHARRGDSQSGNFDDDALAHDSLRGDGAGAEQEGVEVSKFTESFWE